MTKRVRIENADTSDHKIVVEVWDKGFGDNAPDILVRKIELDYPTAMTDHDCYVHSGRYLVVKEVT